MNSFVVLTALVAAVSASGPPHPPILPTPYGVTPIPPYGVTPIPPYGVTPAPYAPLPYTPSPPPYGYSPSPPPYGAPPPPAYGPPPPRVAPAYGPPPVYGPPACSIGNPRPWCLEDKEYPVYEIQQALEYHYDAVQQMYKDVLANTDNSIDRLNEIIQETYLCPTDTAYIQPLRAVNVNGDWRIVVNHVKAHYETLTQTARIEACTNPGAECPLVPECYESKCLQKSIYHRFLVYDPYDQYLPFAIDSFKLPSACACFNGAYIEPPHKK